MVQRLVRQIGTKADWYKGRLVQRLVRQIGTKADWYKVIGKADWYKGGGNE